MKKKASAFLTIGTVFVLHTSAVAEISVAKSDRAELAIGGIVQLLGLGQHVDDPFKNRNRVYLFMKETRLRVSGNYEDYRFNLELGLGPEDVVVAPSPGVSLGLLDFSFNVPLHFIGSSSYLRIGQFKVPYGRERLTYSGYAQFIDRSIQDLGFRVGRDVGAAMTVHPGALTVIAGVFTGGGRDAPQRYLPEKIGFPSLVLRAGVGDVDDDVYILKQNNFAIDKAKIAVFVNGLYTQDTIIGHSSVLNVKLADKSLLLNGNWNPYINQAPLAKGEWWQMGGDLALRAPVGQLALLAEAELNYGGFSNTYGVLHSFGGRAQAGVLKDSFQVALRYAFLFPDKNFANSGVQITGDQPIQEVTPAITYYFHRDMMKLVADLPVLIHTPVIVENNVGAYVGTEFPDQTSVLSRGGMVGRQTVVEGRLMFQAQF